MSVRRKQLPPPEPDEFYVADILGAAAFLKDGTAIGSVVEVNSYPASEVVVIEGNGKRYEVPLVDDFIETIDTAAKRIVLHSVDGFEA